MKKTQKTINSIRGTVAILLLTLCVACQTEQKTVEEAPKGLKDYYDGYFTMGVAVSPRSFEDSSAALIKQHYQSLTAENVMKMGPIHPTRDSFNWTYADEMIAFAKANGMKVRGHALCWHNQAPDWFFINEDSSQVSKEELYKRLEAHITEVVTRYKDDVYAWDVVNEAISDDRDQVFRNSKFYEIAGGEEFIAKAFEFARAAAPDAKLFYNDYSVVNPIKRQKIYNMVKSFKEAGVPIDGVGIQAHWNIYSPTKATIDSTINKFVDLGVDIQITELDVSVYPGENGRRDKKEDEIDDFTPEIQTMQVAKYDSIFQVFRDNKDKISAVTFWNVSDRYSWLDYFPVRGRKNYPLLFDQNYQPKEAYYKVIDFDK